MSYIGNPIVSTDFPKDKFSGNGSTTAFTMSIAPASVNSVLVIVSGITQSPDTYTISGTTLTFSAAPPTGTDNILVRHLGVAGIPNVPADASVTSAKLASGDLTISGLTVGKGGGAVSTNTAVGSESLLSNTTASNNTAVGFQAGYSTTTGTRITALGANATYTNTTGNYNTSIGYDSLTFNSTGSFNTACGDSSLRETTGSSNTTLGMGAGQVITSGSNNTIIGRYNGNQNGLDIRTASNYIVLSDGDGNPRYYFDNASGDWILNQVTAGYYCLMRYKNQASAYFAVGTQSGASPNFQIYNPSGGGVYLGYSASSWTGVSDERLKNITGEISNGLNKVNQLRAVEFTWKRDETNESQVGLIAQDVQAVLPQAIGENDGYLGVRYTEVIPLLVAAIKELNAKVDAQAVEIAALKGTV